MEIESFLISDRSIFHWIYKLWAIVVVLIPLGAGNTNSSVQPTWQVVLSHSNVINHPWEKFWDDSANGSTL